MATTTSGGSAEAPIAARLFGCGTPPTGEEAQLTFWSSQVEVRSARGVQRVPLAILRAREVVSAEAGLELSWDARGGSCALQVFSPAAIARLRSHPLLREMAQMARLRASRMRSRAWRTVAVALLGLFVLLPVLALLAFLWQADRIAGAIAGRIPVAREQQLGRQVFARMRDSLKLQEQGESLLLVRSLGERLTRESRFRYEFHVAADPAINAFALPGGIIVVHTGLIEATRSPDELAGVLAHEVQHVELRHGLKGLVKQLGLRGLWAAFTGDAGGTLAGEAAVQLGSLRFSRAAELQADAGGFDALVARGFDPRGMVDFFGTMEKAAGATPPPWLSSHPTSAERQQALQARLEGLEPAPGR
ncbi:MAG TPA: M48 family metallopeptidase [Steroidobacteraceae bacterium]|nr:M48 family metallopeptidase [Steroidobacteraceae bacterium]